EPGPDLGVGVAPVIPSLTVPTTAQNGSYTISWNRPASATHFDLQEYKNGGWSTVADNTSSTSTSRPHIGGIYQYRVRAYNAHGTRGYTAASAEVKVKPPKPTNFTTSTTQAVDSQFTLRWNASPGASNYTIRKRK